MKLYCMGYRHIGESLLITASQDEASQDEAEVLVYW